MSTSLHRVRSYLSKRAILHHSSKREGFKRRLWWNGTGRAFLKCPLLAWPTQELHGTLRRGKPTWEPSTRGYKYINLKIYANISWELLSTKVMTSIKCSDKLKQHIWNLKRWKRKLSFFSVGTFTLPKSLFPHATWRRDLEGLMSLLINWLHEAACVTWHSGIWIQLREVTPGGQISGIGMARNPLKPKSETMITL